MKSSVLLTSALAAFVSAAPGLPVMKRQDSDEANGLANGNCAAVTFVFARGTSEGGNIGNIIGPELEAGLQSVYGASNVATQGVDYGATLLGNLDSAGCSSDGINGMIADLQQAMSQCPQTKLVAGGYSQGAACLHGAFAGLDAATLNFIVGAVTFGDTRNKQSGGTFPGYPADRTKIFCAFGDLVCDGTLIVTPAHLSYGDDAGAATQFLSGLIGAI